LDHITLLQVYHNIYSLMVNLAYSNTGKINLTQSSSIKKKNLCLAADKVSTINNNYPETFMTQ
jgi:hypothetical protein